MNLEDVHRSIITDDADPELSQFPLPGRNIGGSMNSMGAGASQPGSSVSGSVIRRPSVGKFANSSGNQDQGSYRQRRTSNATGSLSKATPGDNTAARAQRRRPSIASSLNSVNSLTPPIPSREFSTGSGHARNAQEARAQVANPASRTTKAKSLQPPPRPQVTTSAPLKPTLTPEHARPTSFATADKSPNSPNVRLHKSAIPAPGTSRRISTIPHASGLGARTISPTDARRLKRLSTIRTPPPPVDSQRTTPASPALIPRKSITPSSSTNTPEPMRKSYSSGISTASNTPSARTSTASLQPRLSQNISLSRLPTAKVSRQSNEDDEIPPVPPLPKSLVSPPTMSAEFAVQSSVPPEPPKHKDITPIKVSTEITTEPTSTASTRRRRGMTLGATNKVTQTLEPKASVSSLNKKNLAPLRLPPLNLLPLSTPTISRVNALGNTSDTEELTPPRRYGHKTPSTPMTASKATFFGRSSVADGSMMHQRSTSSINHASSRIPSPELSSFRGDSSASSNIPISNSSRFGRETISPYNPQPMPRQSLDYGQGHDCNSLPEVKNSSKVLGLPMPRDKSRQKKHKDEPQPQERDTPDTPSSSSSLRRKLSLSWKRGMKVSHAANERESEYPPKYEGMPPPRLPASATWAPGSVSTPSPSKTTHGRRKSIVSTNTTSGHDRTKSESWNSNTTGSPRREASLDKSDEASVHPPQYQAYHPPTQNNMGPPPLPPAKSTTSSILSPVHKMLSNKTSLGQIRRDRQPHAPHDPTLDSDDLVAEEEMRKLASKRKNLESATQELEALQRRAVPKEKLSPTQASRSVNLNIFERGEIVDYKDVYFCGLEGAKKHIGDLNSSSGANFGYDDDRGDYMIVKGDHLAYRYEIIDVLGKGSFGQVVRCIDHKTGGLVAIKIIRNKKRFHQQALVEVNILQKLKEWVSLDAFLNTYLCYPY